MSPMRIVILGNGTAQQPSSGWHTNDLLRAAANLPGDLTIDYVGWNELTTRIDRNGESITDAKQPFQAVLVRGMPGGSLEQVIFRMNLLARLQASGTTVLNSPRSLEIAIDKYLSLSMLAASGLPVPSTQVCQTVEQSLTAFETLGGDVVVKPVFGGEGRGLFRVTNRELAVRSFRAILNLQGVVYLQSFVKHAGFDTRVLVIGDRIFAMRRHNDLDWRTNASRGATCQAVQPTARQLELATKAARSLGTSIAGVDIIEDSDGNSFVLELNGIPGWQSLSKVCDIDVAQVVWKFVLSKTNT